MSSSDAREGGYQGDVDGGESPKAAARRIISELMAVSAETATRHKVTGSAKIAFHPQKRRVKAKAKPKAAKKGAPRAKRSKR